MTTPNEKLHEWAAAAVRALLARLLALAAVGFRLPDDPQ